MKCDMNCLQCQHSDCIRKTDKYIFNYIKSGKCAETQRRYRQTEKGKQVINNYMKSDKRKEAVKRYNQSEKGKQTRARYRQKLKQISTNPV